MFYTEYENYVGYIKHAKNIISFHEKLFLKQPGCEKLLAY